MLKLISKNKTFIIPYVLILITGLIFILLYSKAEIHLFINRFHSPLFDTVFRYITHLGSGIAAAVIAIFLLFAKIRYSIILSLSAITSGIIVQLLKRFVFPGLERPVIFFRDLAELYVIQDINLHAHYSFPSGHSVTAFIIFGTIAFISEWESVKVITLLAAIIVSFSRVYLSQHFLGDILAGSALGMLVLIFFYWYFHILKINWINQSIQNSFRSARK
ncbi:MAG: hypothetical protein AMS27_16685 [Bacteroides sp. SM23_62_1]|nr:MAG: hypothetical protein AMS27_16685 [Bacteroides sp. SM23_62_1]